MFSRRMWADMGEFAMSRSNGVLGFDEEMICKYCFDNSLVIAVLDNVFVGHWGYGPQNPTMDRHFEEIAPQLAIEE